MSKNGKRKVIIGLFLTLIVVCIMTMIYAVLLFNTSLDEGTELDVQYTESNQASYKVWLKENDFYQEKYLDETSDVIASAIDQIEINTSYLLSASRLLTGQSYYTINAYINAYQKADSSRRVWHYKEQIKDKTVTNYDVETTTFLFSDKINIDYEEYYNKMREYNKNYNVALIGELVIEIETKSEFEYSFFQEKTDLPARKVSITIPLTEPVINISKNIPKENSQRLIEKMDSHINYLNLFLAIVMFTISMAGAILLGVTLFKLLMLRSKYNRKLHKILNTYNAIIVNVHDIDLNEMNIMDVTDFEELLDAQSELRIPILYSEIKKNKESIFVLKKENDAFVYRMTANSDSGDNNE